MTTKRLSAAEFLSVFMEKYVWEWPGFYRDRAIEFAEAYASAQPRWIAEAREVLQALVEQFHAYENGWMDGKPENWRYRIGLKDELKRAKALLADAPEGDQS